MKLTFALFMFAATIGQAGAQPSQFTGKKLFDLCSSDQSKNNAQFFGCVMYARGFLDGYSARETEICLPGWLTPGEAVAAFVRVWRSIETQKGPSNMAPLAEAGSEYAFSAIMMIAYPCKPSR